MNKKLFVSLQCLQTGILLNYFLVYFNGIIYTQPGLAVNQLEQLPFAIPSMDLQEQFVSIAEQADKSEFELRKSIEAIDAVIKSLINS